MSEESKNPFEIIEPKDQAPESLKKEVMSTIRFTHLILDITDLFTRKIGTTALNMIEGKGISSDPGAPEQKESPDK